MQREFNFVMTWRQKDKEEVLILKLVKITVSHWTIIVNRRRLYFVVYKCK